MVDRVHLAVLVGCTTLGPLSERSTLPAHYNETPAAPPLLTVQPSETRRRRFSGGARRQYGDVVRRYAAGAGAYVPNGGAADRTRWPGGSESDNFHWKTDSLGQGPCGGGYVNTQLDFRQLPARHRPSGASRRRGYRQLRIESRVYRRGRPRRGGRLGKICKRAQALRAEVVERRERTIRIFGRPISTPNRTIRPSTPDW